MMERQQIIRILQHTYSFLRASEIDLLLNIAQYQKLKNRAILIETGQRKATIFFILQGMVRGFYINQKGEEINIFLRPEHTITGPPDTLFENEVTKYTFEAILETHVLFFSFHDFQALIVQHPRMAKLYIAALQENLQTLLFRVESLVGKLPEERYDELLKAKPQFFQKAFNKHIANYLGITPNSLSRIIKRKKESNN